MSETKTITSEKALQIKIHRVVGGRNNIRLFRNTCGFDEARKIRYGLTPGSSDLIGWVSKIITPEMVGQKVAVFVAVEIKTDTGRATQQQTNFIEQVNAHGGIAGVARSVEEAERMVE